MRKTLSALSVLVLLASATACASTPKAAASTEASGPGASPVAASNPAGLILNGRQVSDALLVGGQPTAEQIERLARSGYQTMITLQTEGEPGVPETLATARKAGLTLVHLPIGGLAEVTRANATRLGEALAGAQGPVVLHCRSGNRAAALYALSQQQREGLSDAQTLELADRAGLTSKGLRIHLEEILAAE